MLDGCRVSWGRVTALDGAELVVDRVGLELRDGCLALADPRSERVLRQVEGRGFADEARVGDWVSLHWGWVCEVLDAGQRRALEHYTRRHLKIANRTL